MIAAPGTIRIFKPAVLALLLVGGSAAIASAGTTFTVAIAAGKIGAAEACSKTAVQAAGAAAAAKTDTVTVTLDGKHSADLHLTVESVGSVVILKAGATEAKFPAAAYANNKLLVMAGGRKVCELMLAPPAAPTTTPTTPTPTEPGSSTPPSALVALEQRARATLDSKNITDHQVVHQSNFGRTIRVYHLPTGAPAFPLPRHVNEKDDLEIWTVVPEDATISIEVTSCDKVPAVRVGGTYSAAKEAAGVLESGEQKPIAFKLHSHAKRLNCSGTLSYKIDVSYEGLASSTTTSIAFDPVYRFEWGIGFMFDFGRPHQLSLGDRPTADGLGSEKFVIESDDYTGSRPFIALGINVCGTNPSEMTWCDRLINPTLIVDPTRLTSGFGAGLTFRPFHGFGLLAGVTVFKSTVLADGADTKLGETWSIAGDLPTKDVFDSDSIGFVLGAVISTDVFAELKK